MMRRVGGLALIVVLAAGCYGYVAAPVPRPGADVRLRGRNAKVTLSDGRQLTMEHAYVRGDSLRTEGVHSGGPVAVALRDVRNMQIDEYRAGETLRWTVIIGGTLLLGAIFYVMATDPS